MATKQVRLRGAALRFGLGLATGSLPKELLLCGAAGTGKTWSILALLHARLRSRGGMRMLLGRKVRSSLAESCLVTFEQEVLPLFGDEAMAEGPSRSNRRNYRYPNGSEIVLCGLDKPGKALSSAYDVIFINEAVDLTIEDWETLGSRLDRPGRTGGILLGDTNPADPMHFLKQRADAGTLPLWQSYHRDNPRLHDGRGWTEEGLIYLDRLKTLTGTRRRRLLEGTWAAGEGAWFPAFDHETHVSEAAEYDPRRPVHLAADNNGLHTGAVWFQVRESAPFVNVFGDFYDPNPDRIAFDKATAMRRLGEGLCGGRVDVGTHDPAAGARTGLNTTVAAEYERAGLFLEPWPSFPGSVLSGLNLIESLLGQGLVVHPRCRHLIAALGNYRRAQARGQWLDRPEDPQHPHEDLIDALKGGLLAKWPDGRRPDLKLPRIDPRRVF